MNGNRWSGLAVQDRLQVIPGSKKVLDRRPHILNLSPVKAPRKNFSDQQCLFISERLSKAIQRPPLSFTRKDYRKPRVMSMPAETASALRRSLRAAKARVLLGVARGFDNLKQRPEHYPKIKRQ